MFVRFGEHRPVASSSQRHNRPRNPAAGVRFRDPPPHEALLQERLVSLLATVFGALALVLACIGLYGVLSYSIVRRTREIGIRIAVGARPADLAWVVLRQAFVVVACGVAVGVPVALWVARFVERQLFDVTTRDPLAIAGAMLSLIMLAAIAGLIPARRASRIDPIHALRCE